MKRRTVLGGLVGVAGWHVPAQSQAKPTIGFLSALSKPQVASQLDAFARGLGETGFVAGRNVGIEYRFAEGRFDELPGMAAELVGLGVSLILAQAPPAALAAKAATSNIPIVFVVGFDPVGAGLVANLSRPGSNATGMTLISNALGQKRLELLLEFTPKASVIGVLVNPKSPDTAPEVRALEAGAQSLKVRLVRFEASAPAEIESAFADITRQRIGALVVATDPFFLNERQNVVRRANGLRVCAVYPFRDYADAGGLFSYGTNIPASYRRAGIYAGRILKGEKPADLPVMQPTAFELVINLKTATALGMDIPATLLARADEVIE